MNKEGYEFSFAWLFTVILGAFIIFFAIYAATNIIETKRFEAETVSARQFGVLLNPTETNLESARLTTIAVPSKTRIINDCSDNFAEGGTFGSQEISAQVKSGVGKNEWTESPGAASSFHNKYIFSNEIVEGEKEFYVLSKPFEFPFKIADLLIITSDEERYCFVLGITGDEGKIRQEINDLKPKNIEVKDSAAGCSQGAKRVFFGLAGACRECEIIVELDRKIVNRGDSAPVHYVESFAEDKYALLYAAIFSNPEIYDCQIKRLTKRAAETASLYEEKAKFFYARDGCAGPLIQGSLSRYNEVMGREDSFANTFSDANEVNDKNERLRCKLF